ncbi:MAG: dihydroorotase [Chloroflexi bacterium]|nr:dihydroorotase [Chloroflexota bacterium]
MPARSWLIRGARLVDASTGMDRSGDLLLADGRVLKAGEAIREGDVPPGCAAVAGDGLVACPGFIDLHAHFREPGYEDKETIATGALAAARGGFATVCCMPNTNPPMDNASVVDYVLRRAREANLVRVLPIGCVTKGRAGRELAEMWEMAQAGVVGFSDDGNGVADASLMRQALTYAGGLGLPVIDHCEDPSLSQGAPVNEGWVSNRVGLRGWPAAAEEVMVARDIALAEVARGRLHLAHLTTAGSVELVRQAKQRGLAVTAEVTPHHLTLDERWVLGHDSEGPLAGPLMPWAYDTATKVNPPLRSQADTEALLQGLQEGVIDLIATDHAPQALADKLVTYDDAAYGISGLETAVGALLTLVHRGRLSLMTLVERLTLGPLRVLGGSYRELGTLRPGSPADIVLLDLDGEWVVRSSEFASKGRNTPLEGVTLRGRVVATFVGGQPVHSLLRDVQGEPVESAR